MLRARFAFSTSSHPNMTHRIVLSLGLATLAGSALAAPDLSKLPPASTQSPVTYQKDIRPLFEASCMRCHGAERQKGDLRLDSLEAALKGGKNGETVVPGKSDKSSIVIAAARIDEETAMPPMRGGRRRGPGGPGGPGGAGGPPPPPAGAQDAQGQGNPGGHGSNGGPGGQPGGPGHGGPGGGGPSKPLTPQQVGLLRAWIDQGAK